MTTLNLFYIQKNKRNRFSHLIFVTVLFDLINIIIFSLIHIVIIFFNLTKTSFFIYPIAHDNYFICSHLLCINVYFYIDTHNNYFIYSHFYIDTHNN